MSTVTTNDVFVKKLIQKTQIGALKTTAFLFSG